jgi:hypothetical protein
MNGEDGLRTPRANLVALVEELGSPYGRCMTVCLTWKLTNVCQFSGLLPRSSPTLVLSLNCVKASR